MFARWHSGDKSFAENNRVTIARMILKMRLLLLDEAIGYVDPDNEQKFTRLNVLIADKTLIVIAHHISHLTCRSNIVLVNNKF